MSDVDPEALIEGFREKLQTQWKQHRKQAFNANTKGAAYENALKHFLDEYFDGVFSIRTRTAVIDQNLSCFDIFNAGESEIDVVASFKQAVPEIILESGDMKWVSYDAVAFICEVKSKLTASALESDLEKLAKLTELDPDDPYNRFPRPSTDRTELFVEDSGQKQKTTTTVNHQVKCLVYDESSVAGDTLLNRLQEFTDIWDLVLVVDRDILIISPNLPFVEGWYQRINIPDENVSANEIYPDILVLQDGIVWFILLLSASVPRPPAFDASSALMQLAQRQWMDDVTAYDRHAGFWHKLFSS
jgi:hypothetical protein